MQEDPRGDREWDHWPGRRASDDGIRHRLRALFSTTDDEDAVEALIVERGREIEQRTEQLQTTISDLERREEQTGQLRSAVEDMLRHGSAELDERHAELAALALDLRTRAEKVRADERDIAVRKQELGAVELRRAAVERRERSLSEREKSFEQVAADLAERERQLAAAESTGPTAGPVEIPRADTNLLRESRLSDRDDAATDVGRHIVFLSDGGYRIVEQPGGAAPPGTRIEFDGSTYVVTRVGRSPIPGDRRPWVYLEASQAQPSA